MDEVGLGRTLQEARQKAGLTQQELCQKASLSYSTLAKIERGAIKSPSIFTIQNIADALGLSLDVLLGHTPPTAQHAPQGKRTSKSGVKFIYFDINGCLVHFFHGAFNRLALDTGASSDAIESTFWHYNDQVCKGEVSLEDFNKSLAAALGVNSIDWKSYYLAAVDPVPGMNELLQWVAQNYQTGLLSNIMPGFIDAMLKTGLIPDVDYSAIIDSSEVGAIKPEQKIYEIAAATSNVNPNEILLVDDSRPNLMAAEHMGWRVMWFDNYHPEESVQKIRSALEF